MSSGAPSARASSGASFFLFVSSVVCLAVCRCWVVLCEGVLCVCVSYLWARFMCLRVLRVRVMCVCRFACFFSFPHLCCNPTPRQRLHVTHSPSRASLLALRFVPFTLPLLSLALPLLSLALLLLVLCTRGEQAGDGDVSAPHVRCTQASHPYPRRGRLRVAHGREGLGFRV